MKRFPRLLPYILPYWRGLTVVLLTMIVGVGFHLLQPWPTKLLVDNLLGDQPMPDWLTAITPYLPGSTNTRGLLVWVALATVFLFAANTALSMISTTAFVSLGQRMVYDLASDLFLHLQRLSPRFHGHQQVGDLVARVTVDTYCVQALIIGTLFPLLHSGITLIAVFSVMWSLAPAMALLTLAVVPLLALIIGAFAKVMEESARIRSDLDGQLMSLVEQTLSALPAVQAFVRERIEHERFRRVADKSVAAHRKSTLVDMWFKLLVGLVTAIGSAGILWLGATYALEGKITVGTILVFLAYLGALYEPINSIVYTTSTLQTLSANAARVVEVLDTPADVADAPDAIDVAIRGHVKYEYVSFAYETDRPVLRDVSFEARPGEVIAIVGPTGAGKTTLANLLIRFFNPTSGRITVDSRELSAIKYECLRRQIAVVLQEPFLFPLSIADNIAYGRPTASRGEIIEAARAANADEFIRRLPEGYDTVIGERGVTLSGGERQRLGIARAFLKNARILILDEPTSAVDALTESLLLQTLDRLTEGRTTFIIAHRLSTIRRADRILVLERGRIVESGNHDELLAAGGLFAQLHQQYSQGMLVTVGGEDDD